MATRSKGGLLVPIVAVVAAVAVFGVDDVVDTVTDAVGSLTDGGTEIIGQDDTAFMVASSARPEVDECDAPRLVAERKCKIPVLVIDAAKMPYIARNIRLAWSDEGKPGVLHREEDPVKQKMNRNTACSKVAKAPLSGSCDEFPIASSKEGGSGARVEGVPMEEQCAQGWVVMETARVNNMRDGDPFAVAIINPGKIAADAYAGSMWLGAGLDC